MATGENLFSMQDARNLIRYGGMRPDRDWLQFDCALSYGLVEYLRTLRMLKDYGWSASRCIPHGGHQMSLAIAAGLGLGGNESYPDLFQPYGGFPDGVAVRDGYVDLPPLPGIGFEGKADLIAQMRDAGALIHCTMRASLPLSTSPSTTARWAAGPVSFRRRACALRRVLREQPAGGSATAPETRRPCDFRRNRACCWTARNGTDRFHPPCCRCVPCR